VGAQGRNDRVPGNLKTCQAVSGYNPHRRGAGPRRPLAHAKGVVWPVITGALGGALRVVRCSSRVLWSCHNTRTTLDDVRGPQARLERAHEKRY